jgi:hypothetical protein
MQWRATLIFTYRCKDSPVLGGQIPHGLSIELHGCGAG